MRAGALDGLSIGFRAVKGRRDARTGVRRLDKVDLWEISVVTFPMLPEARVAHVKSRARRAPRRRHRRRHPPAAHRGSVRLVESARSGETQPPARAASPTTLGLRPPCRSPCLSTAAPIVAAPTHHSPSHAPHQQGPPPMLETKSAAGGDVASAFDDFMRAFEAFKDDQRRAPRRDRAPPVGRRRHHREARPHRPRARRAEARRRRARAQGPRARRSAGGAALRRSPLAAQGGLRRLCAQRREPPACASSKQKALSVGSGPDGGYLVPDETEREINRAVQDVSPIRAIAGVRQVSGSVYKQALRRSPAPATGWVGRDRGAAGDRQRRRSPSCPSRRWSSTPCRRRRRRCSTTPPSTSTSGSPRRCATAFAAAGGHRLRHRRRHQQAEGLPRLHQGRRTARWTWGNIGYIVTGVAGALRRPPTRPTS